MAVRPFALPDLGEGLQEAEIVEWHVSEGDRVVADQPLVSVETDKAVVEVPSPWSGTLVAVRAQPGDVLKIGAVLAEIDDGSRVDAGAIVGSLEPEQSAPPAAPKPGRAPAEVAAPVRATPAVRAFARERGVDLSGVTGTGPDGAITRRDVESAIPEGAGAPRASAARRSMARAMAQAHAVVVPATLTDDADITAWHDAAADVIVRLVRAICIASRAEPLLATWYDPDGRFGKQPEGIAIAIAVDTPQGLYVPVLAEADALDAGEVRDRLGDIVSRVRERRPDAGAALKPAISLSNFGPIGGRHAALVVTPPQVAILGAGRAYEMAAWKDGGPARGVMLPLSLTFDHRAVTGGDAARFMAAAKADLEQPT